MLADIVPDNKFLEQYLDTQISRLSKVIDPESIDREKLREYAVSKIKNHQLSLYNNVKNTRMTSNAMRLLDILMHSKQKPIVTAHNTIFYNQNKVKNVPGLFVQYLLDRRKVIKKEMFKHINDEDKSIYKKLDIEQGVIKIFANSFYGAFGQKSFQFFNEFLGPSTTAQGQQIIISAILGFEGFLSDNIQFDCFDSLVYFIENILKEEWQEEFYIEDAPEITVEMLVKLYKSRSKFEFTERQEDYLTAYFEDLPITLMQKFYYKNRMFELFKIPSIAEVIKENFVRNDFPDVHEPPEEIHELLDEFFEVLKYFVTYYHPVPNKSDVVNNLYRKTVIISDTDSTFLNVDPYFRFVANLAEIDVATIDKHTQIGIVSVMTYFVTKFVNSVFYELCKNMNTLEEYIPRINMKSELTV